MLSSCGVRLACLSGFLSGKWEGAAEGSVTVGNARPAATLRGMPVVHAERGAGDTPTGRKISRWDHSRWDANRRGGIGSPVRSAEHVMSALLYARAGMSGNMRGSKEHTV